MEALCLRLVDARQLQDLPNAARLAAVQHYRALQPVPIRAKGATPDVRWPRWPELRCAGNQNNPWREKKRAEPENTITATCSSHLLLLPKSNQVLPAASTSARPGFCLFDFVSFLSASLYLSLPLLSLIQRTIVFILAFQSLALDQHLVSHPRLLLHLEATPSLLISHALSCSGSLRLPVSCFPKEAVSSPHLRP